MPLARSLAAALVVLAVPVRSQQAEAPAPLQHVAEVGERLRALAAAHPERARLEQVGRSLSGREIVALRIGPTEGEPPGVLLVSGLDGRRLGDVDALLGVAEALLADAPPGAPDRLAQGSITVLPLANPDGAAALLGEDGVRRERAGNGRADDADRDGRTDEDGPDDLDGDGLITWMRVPDPEGEWVADTHDSRALRKARPERGERGTFRVLAEGHDDDADGADSEDGSDGVQPDHNFMQGWKEHDAASGALPLSEPESRALCEFVQARPTLFAVLVVGAQDTLADLPKGEAKVPDDWEGPLPSLIDDDLAVLKELQRRFRALPGGKDHKVKGDGLTGGSFLAWAYHQGGRLPLALRLWEPPTELPKPEGEKGDKGENGDKAEKPAGDEKAAEGDEKPDEPAPDAGAPRGKKKGDTSDEADEDKPGSDAGSPVPAAVLAWLDKDRAGAGFHAWAPFHHPQLGDVEIGGLLPGTLQVVPPSVVAEKVPLVMALALEVLDARAHLTFEDLRAERGADGLYTLHATLVNTGTLPALTALARSARTTRPVSVRLQLPDGAARLAGPVAARAGRLDGGGGREEFRWVVAASTGQVVHLQADSDALPAVTAEISLP